jgi:hypothetical protein
MLREEMSGMAMLNKTRNNDERRDLSLRTLLSE